jgi:murein DD-endopeptidase MepM/ murein hydrolase activator NlpD
LKNRGWRVGRLISFGAWIFALGVLALAFYLYQRIESIAQADSQLPDPTLLQTSTPANLKDDSTSVLPQFALVNNSSRVTRKPLLRTIIPQRPDVTVKSYTVVLGDSLFEIASTFKIKPETLLWANYDLLNDNPDTLSLDMQLQVPPVDGVLYTWQEGDTLQSVAGRFEARIDDILSWSGNSIDLANPKIEPGSPVMLPGGHREFRQWIIPAIPRGRAGVSASVYGAGACSGPYEGAYGSGAFIWPAGNHSLSGNDYWSGHLAIDIAAGEGAPVVAADSGVVVFSGWATGGYGYMVMIDHGNGYQTLYAHLSSTSANCGSSLSQGSVLGYAGSTGNSTGPHLHFEVRYQGGFVNPWFVLPAP